MAATGPFVRLTRRGTTHEHQTGVVWVNVAQIQAVHERRTKDGDVYAELWLAGDDSAMLVNEAPDVIMRTIARPYMRVDTWEQVARGLVLARE